MLGAWVVALVSAAIAGSEIATGVALVGGVLALTFVGRDRGDARKVAVRIEGATLHVGDRAIPVSDVRELHRERGVTYDAVEVVTEALRITLQGKPAKTTRILEALRTATGLTDPTPIESLVGHALGVPGWDDAFAWLVASAGIALVAATLLGHVPFGLAFPLAMLLTAAWVVATRPGSVVAERDGVHVRWLWIRRFIHVREITTTAARGPRETLIVTATRRWVLRAATMTSLERVNATLTHAVDTAHAEAPLEAPELMPRSRLRAKDWLDALRHRPAGAYRVAESQPDTLWRIAEDPTADAELRVAASVALSRTGARDPERLRVASNDVANPHLRIALRAIADEDDEAAARAIDDLAQQR